MRIKETRRNFCVSYGGSRVWHIIIALCSLTRAKIAIVYVESTLALEENFASDCRAELRNTIDADVAVFWLEVFGGHAEKRVDFMLGSLSDFPGRVGMFPAFDLRAEPGRQSSSSDGPVALRCESERVISSVTDYLFPGRYFFDTDYPCHTRKRANDRFV